MPPKLTMLQVVIDICYCRSTLWQLIIQPQFGISVVNSLKITPIKYLICGVSNNQGTKTKCMGVINTSKIKKQQEKRRENTQNLFTQFGPKLT